MLLFWLQRQSSHALLTSAGSLLAMSAKIDQALVSSVAGAKAYQAGIIRAFLYQRINQLISIPSMNTNIGVQDFTAAIASYVNRLAAAYGGISIMQPLVDSSGAHLTNLDSEGHTFTLLGFYSWKDAKQGARKLSKMKVG